MTMEQYGIVKIGDQIVEIEENKYPELNSERKTFTYEIFEIKRSSSNIWLRLRDINDKTEISITYNELDSVLSDGTTKRFKKI